MSSDGSRMRVGLIVPHIFMQDELLPKVIFAPGRLALDLSVGLQQLGVDVTLFTPGPVKTEVKNITADLTNFKAELKARGDTYLELLKKHPLTFISLARQVQGELLAKAYSMANNDQLDALHIYTNEEDIALPFAQLCRQPIVFTHHDPFNFQAKYRTVFPKYKHYSWLSLSLAQRQGMPPDTTWVGNIYNAIGKNRYHSISQPRGHYVAYLGRIIEPKGLHLALAALKIYNQTATRPLTLKIAGKHYASQAKDSYWQKYIQPQLGRSDVEFVGFINNDADKQKYLGNARALLMPSLFEEPFGMVMIEALACGTPVIGVASGAIPEVISRQDVGKVIPKSKNESVMARQMAAAMEMIPSFSRERCREEFEKRFTLDHMCEEHRQVYEQMIVGVLKI